MILVSMFSHNETRYISNECHTTFYLGRHHTDCAQLFRILRVHWTATSGGCPSFIIH